MSAGSDDILSRAPLSDILATRKAKDAAGVEHDLHSEIPPLLVSVLNAVVRQLAPATSLEVGMAFGLSGLAIGLALSDLGGSGRLISVDPNQHTQWHGVGVANIARIGMASRHTLIEEPSYLALPKLLMVNTKLDFAYIDGWHTFDYTLIDFFYIDKMLGVGGVVAFNDVSFPSVAKVLDYVLSHRRYVELDVGFPPGVRGVDRYVRKLEDWEPGWDFFSPF